MSCGQNLENTRFQSRKVSKVSELQISKLQIRMIAGARREFARRNFLSQGWMNMGRLWKKRRWEQQVPPGSLALARRNDKRGYFCLAAVGLGEASKGSHHGGARGTRGRVRLQAPKRTVPNAWLYTSKKTARTRYWRFERRNHRCTRQSMQPSDEANSVLISC